MPLLRRDFLIEGAKCSVQIGDHAVDYNEKFALYLFTRNPDPFLPPDVAPLVTTVNFSTTRSGLEGQLLGMTYGKSFTIFFFCSVFFLVLQGHVDGWIETVHRDAFFGSS